FDEIDGKIVGAGRIARLGIESQTLGANRLIALTGVIEVVGDATLSHLLLNPAVSHRNKQAISSGPPAHQAPVGDTHTGYGASTTRCRFTIVILRSRSVKASPSLLFVSPEAPVGIK